MENVLAVSSILLWVAILFNLILSVAIIRHVKTFSEKQPGQPGFEFEMLKEGENAPDFELKNLGGNLVRAEDYKNQKLSMVFVSPTCAPCRKHMPQLDSLYATAQKSGTELMVISLAGEKETQSLINETGFGAPIYSVNDVSRLLTDYKIAGTPFYYTVSSSGKVITGGFLDEGKYDDIGGSIRHKTA